jgi:hypothetical protein
VRYANSRIGFSSHHFIVTGVHVFQRKAKARRKGDDQPTVKYDWGLTATPTKNQLAQFENVRIYHRVLTYTEVKNIALHTQAR